MPTLRAALAALLLPALAAAQAPDTTAYVVINHGRLAGEMRVIRRGDSATVRFRYQDRQRGPRNETRYHFGPGGTVLGLAVQGLNAQMFPTESSESFTRDGVAARWTQGTDSGATANAGSGFYLTEASTPYHHALLARHLLAQPQQSGKLLPVGQARAFVAAETTVTFRGAPTRLRFTIVDFGEGAPDGI